MSNYPSQDQSWSGRSSRDEQYGRFNRDPYRDQEFGGNQRRQWSQESGRHSNEGAYADNPYQHERDFYDQNPMSSNFGAQRGGRLQHRTEPWPRNEDRENYSSAGEYGRPDYFDEGSNASIGRYQAAGSRRDHQQRSRDWGSAGRGYSQPYRDYGQSYGGPTANYSQAQDNPWRESRSQFQSPRGYQGDSFAQGDYGSPQYGLQRGTPQPGYFQAGEFSQRGGYTRSEYPEDSSYLYGQSPDNQQAGRAMGTQNWQEREGAQRGAFGLQSSHRGRGPQGYTRSDERIREDVCERLSEHHYVDASQIRVEVNQGVVTLEGSVDDRWQKYQTEDLVDAISGVKDIQNRLNVSRASQQSAQWTSQTGNPQTATSTPQQAAGDSSAGKRPLGDKITETNRKPGTSTN